MLLIDVCAIMLELYGGHVNVYIIVGVKSAILMSLVGVV
jgi:hypothetical protein